MNIQINDPFLLIPEVSHVCIIWKLFFRLQTDAPLDIPVVQLRSVLNFRTALSGDWCFDVINNVSSAIYVMEVAANGFFGVYKPQSEILQSLLLGLDKMSMSATRRLLATTPLGFNGITNPVTCVEHGEAVMFVVSRKSYPVYDL